MNEQDEVFQFDLNDAHDALAVQKLQAKALWKIGNALEDLAFQIHQLRDESGKLNLNASVTVEKDDWSIPGA